MDKTQEQLEAELATIKAELETLKATHGEVLTKSQSRKSKIAELEAANADFQAKLTAANDTIRQVTIDGPVRQMCESISTAPELFQEQLSKYFKVELIDGKLTLLSVADSKPGMKNGKSLPFERDALAKFTDGDDARAKAFRVLTITSRASGGNAASVTRKAGPSDTTKPAIKFGLR